MTTATPLFVRDSFAISPDGRLLAYAAMGNDGTRRIWLRAMDTLNARPIAGTEGVAQTPIWWSPDSRHVAFPTGTVLKRLDVSSGVVQTICTTALNIVGGSWSREDVIIFGQNQGPVMRVAASGGSPVPLTAPTGGVRQHIHPQFLTDGRRFLYRAAGDCPIPGMAVGHIDTPRRPRAPTSSCRHRPRSRLFQPLAVAQAASS